MNPAGIILGIALVAIEPLTEDQRVRLATAFDGRDHQEAAFVKCRSSLDESHLLNIGRKIERGRLGGRHSPAVGSTA